MYRCIYKNRIDPECDWIGYMFFPIQLRGNRTKREFILTNTAHTKWLSAFHAIYLFRLHRWLMVETTHDAKTWVDEHVSEIQYEWVHFSPSPSHIEWHTHTHFHARTHAHNWYCYGVRAWYVFFPLPSYYTHTPVFSLQPYFKGRKNVYVLCVRFQIHSDTHTFQHYTSVVV